jgi:hypothetical protein
MSFEDYASIAVVEIFNSAEIAISSISVTQSEVSLSGGWTFKLVNQKDIQNVLSNKILINLSGTSTLESLVPHVKSQLSTFNDFLLSAKQEADVATAGFIEYQQADFNKRKKIVPPTFFEWPSEINLNEIENELKKFGLQEKIVGTENEMQGVLSAARLLKFFIQKWQSDEQSRSNRKYVIGDSAKVTILPPSFFRLSAINAQ